MGRGGVQSQRDQLQYLGVGGGRLLQNVHKRMYAHTHMYAHMHTHAHAVILFTHPCIHAYTHVFHTCICSHILIHLHPGMKIIKIKASGLYEKQTNKYIHVNLLQRGKYLVIILPKSYLNLHTFIYMHC